MKLNFEKSSILSPENFNAQVQSVVTEICVGETTLLLIIVRRVAVYVNII